MLGIALLCHQLFQFLFFLIDVAREPRCSCHEVRRQLTDGCASTLQHTAHWIMAHFAPPVTAQITNQISVYLWPNRFKSFCQISNKSQIMTCFGPNLTLAKTQHISDTLISMCCVISRFTYLLTYLQTDGRTNSFLVTRLPCIQCIKCDHQDIIMA